MKSKFTIRDGAYYLTAELMRVDGIIKKGITRAKYLSFGIDVKSGNNNHSIKTNMVAKIAKRDGSYIVKDLKGGMNTFCIPTRVLDMHNVVVKVTAKYRLGIGSSKTLKLSVAKAF